MTMKRSLLLLMALGPHYLVLVSICLNLGPIHKVVLQLDLANLDQIVQHLSKHCLDHTFHPAAPKVVDCPKVRPVATAQPHEVDILPQRFGNPARRIDLLGVAVHQDLEQHLRMVAGGPTTGVPRHH